MVRAKRVCLITGAHVASNPRIVKEANALHAAGFRVKLVAAGLSPDVDALDERIFAEAPWAFEKIEFSDGGYVIRRARQLAAKKAFSAGWRTLQTAVAAHSMFTSSLFRVARAEPADLFIAHYLDALPAAVMAARHHHGKAGFDAEDDHVGEVSDAENDLTEIAIRHLIEAEFIPRCDHLTAASPGIARAYNARYGVSMTPILNVFPLSEARTTSTDQIDRTLSVYWFSQTIGPGRGLETFIRAMGEVQQQMRLCIRGNDFLGYSRELMKVAAEAGVADAVSFEKTAAPDLMVDLAARHDIGLSFELNTPPHRAICLPNKVFTYLLAGLPVLLSNTPAHRELASELGAAAQVVNLDDRGEIAAALRLWSEDRSCLAAAKKAARRLGRERFNWDREKKLFLYRVRSAIGAEQTQPG